MKATLHAFVIPMALAIAAFIYKKEYSLLVFGAYLLFACTIYSYKYIKDKEDEAAFWFFRIGAVYAALLFIVLLLVMIGALQGSYQ
ncbi:hypothetical protein ACXWTF_12850 [Thiomicrolovo sp. ZZH C-3]